VCQLRPEASGLVSQFRVLRTGTLSEIRNENMYQTLWVMPGEPSVSKISIDFKTGTKKITFVQIDY
jgi:hypothetical protein